MRARPDRVGPGVQSVWGYETSHPPNYHLPPDDILPGGIYGGWITSDLAGRFKGGPGSAGW